MICLRAVEPRRRRWIVDPGMIRTSVVNDFVLNDLDARAMCGSYQFAQLRERAKVLLNTIEVLWVVAVKAGAGLFFLQFNLVRVVVVVIPRCEPDSRDTEVL